MVTLGESQHYNNKKKVNKKNTQFQVIHQPQPSSCTFTSFDGSVDDFVSLIFGVCIAYNLRKDRMEHSSIDADWKL
jgi:hypothetical protein